MMSLIVGFFGTARIGRGGVGAGPHAQGAQSFVIERLKGLASLLQLTPNTTSIEGSSKQGEQT